MAPADVSEPELIGAAVRCFTSGEAQFVPPSCARHTMGGVHDPAADGDAARAPGAATIYTWRPVSSTWATIVKSGAHETCISFHHDPGPGSSRCPTLYRMPQHLGLAPDCPTGTCMLGQVIFDAAAPPGAEPSPSIWVFDVLQVGASMDLVAARTPPRERYKILRGECEMHTRGSAMRVQWAGDLEPAARFCCGAGSGRAGALPHAVDYIFGLSTGHPFDITRAPAKNDAGGI